MEQSQKARHKVGDGICNSFPMKVQHLKNVKDFYEYTRYRYPNRKMAKKYRQVFQGGGNTNGP